MPSLLFQSLDSFGFVLQFRTQKRKPKNLSTLETQLGVTFKSTLWEERTSYQTKLWIFKSKWRKKRSSDALNNQHANTKLKFGPWPQSCPPETDLNFDPAHPSAGPSPRSSSCRRTLWRWWRARTRSRTACGGAGRPESSAGSPGNAGCTSPTSTPCRGPRGSPWSLPPSSAWPRRFWPDGWWTCERKTNV